MKAILQTPTNKLEDSLAFYAQLGYRRISETGPIYLTDGRMILEINPDRHARAGIKLFNANWEPAVAELQKIMEVMSTESGYILNDASGTWIYLEKGNGPVRGNLPGFKGVVPGEFAAVSMETINLQLSLQIWKILGFRLDVGSVEMGWVNLLNKDRFPISLMRPNTCPHLFFNPSMTFFNGGRNLAIIKKIRDLGIPITEEISCFNPKGIVDNIIIRDPGGLGFFIFND